MGGSDDEDDNGIDEEQSTTPRGSIGGLGLYVEPAVGGSDDEGAHEDDEDDEDDEDEE